jgi:CubicO group peptidase (beta-lactamase class C family)
MNSKFMNCNRILSRLLLLCLVCRVAAAVDFAPLEETARAELKRNRVPGCAVAVVQDGRIALAGGFGTTCIEEGRPVTADTLFRIGSTTKMFTAATVVGLAEEGKLDLSKPVGDYVKDLHPALARVTIHQLLTHTAGFNDPNAHYGPHDDTALGVGLRARDQRLVFVEPGVIYSYANVGFWLAGLLAEEMAGKPYADVVKERVLKPLGMVRSTFRPTEAMTWPFAVGHDPEGLAPPKVVRPLGDNAAVWPAGQLFTTANEFARWCMAFMDGGKLEGSQALSPYVITQLSTPHVPIPGSDSHYGYGLSIRKHDGLTWLSHSGSRLGYGSQMRMCPEKKFAVVILCNKTAANLPRVADKAAELVLGVAPEPPGPHKPLPMTPEEMQRYIGKYSSGLSRTELSIKDDKLTATPGGEVTKVGDNRFTCGATEDGPATTFQLVPGADGQPAFLFRKSRALKRL